MASEQEQKIIRQIEYYFGDSNLPRDRFLQEQLKADDGWVPLETMIKFNRLRQISADCEEIAEAVKKSTTGLLEVSEDNSKVRRNPELPLPENTEEHRQDVSHRTIYAKSFPLDISLDDIQEFFRTFGEVESVFMRKDVQKKFKGSVFVTFKLEESKVKFLKEESVKYKDTELEKRLSKGDYYKGKNEEKRQQQLEKQQKRDAASERQQKDERRNLANDMKKGAILHMSGFIEKIPREDIRNLLQDHGSIAWIEYNRGDKEAFIRYDEDGKAKEVFDKVMAGCNNELVMSDIKIEARVLEGEEEVEKWIKMIQDTKDRAEAKRMKFQESKNYKKGRWGKRPSKNTRNALKAKAAAEKGNQAGAGDQAAAQKDTGATQDNDEPPQKKVKVEASNGD